MSNNKLAITEKQVEVIDSTVMAALGSNATGFQMAFIRASAIQKLKELLTPEYMQPIMAMQGNKLGFRTDRDKDGGYTVEVVKNCLIEAVLMGVQPYGNQFNIIAGNTYITKEGYGYLLSKIPGLRYKIVFSLPRIKDGSAAVVAKIDWSINGERGEQEIDTPVKVNSSMGADAVLGKATRKARAWLYSTITGTELGDGEIEDTEATVVETKQSEPVSPFAETLSNLETVEDVQLFYNTNPDCPEDLVEKRIAEIEANEAGK